MVILQEMEQVAEVGVVIEAAAEGEEVDLDLSKYYFNIF